LGAARRIDVPTCGRPSLLKRLLGVFRRRRGDSGCGDWFVEPPDIGVREPRRPRPGSGSGTAVLDPPL
jgi:hypothetical protein